MMLIPPLSFAQLEDYDFEYAIERDELYMFVQIQIRDSDGNLIGYIETDRVTIIDPVKFTDSLDKTPDDPKLKRNMFIGDQEYEIITGLGVVRHQSDTVVSISAISNDGMVIAYANHDSYPVKSGDVISSTWTIIRPA